MTTKPTALEIVLDNIDITQGDITIDHVVLEDEGIKILGDEDCRDYLASVGIFAIGNSTIGISRITNVRIIEGVVECVL